MLSYVVVNEVRGSVHNAASSLDSDFGRPKQHCFAGYGRAEQWLEAQRAPVEASGLARQLEQAHLPNSLTDILLHRALVKSVLLVEPSDI